MVSKLKYNTTILQNGLRIIHLPVESDVVYCGYAIARGSRHELEGEHGLAHFCEHMTFKGTHRRSPLQVINTLERVGGELNAFTTKQDTFYYSAILHEYFPRAVDLLTDIVFNSTYPQAEIDKEVEVVCDEIESYNDTPADLIYDEFENIVFGNTPLGHNILGETDRVRRFRTADCQSFVRRNYKPSNAVFYVLGMAAAADSFASIVRMVEKALSRCAAEGVSAALSALSDGALPPQAPVPAASAAGSAALAIDESVYGKTFVKTIDSHQAHVMVGTAIPSEELRVALLLLNNILGGPSMNSRLNLSLREKRGLVYSVDSSVTTYADTLLWSVYFGSDHADYKRCLRLIRSEINRLQRAPLSATALRQAKQQLKGQLAIASQNRENYAIDMAKLFLHRNLLKQPDALAAAIDAVTAEQLQSLAQRYLSPNRLTTLVMK